MEIQAFADNWSAQILIVLVVILIPYSFTTLLLSSLRRHHCVFATDSFRLSGKVAIAVAWTGFAVGLLDIFFWHTLVISFVIAFGTAIILTGISCYLVWMAKQKFGLTVYINNG